MLNAKIMTWKQVKGLSWSFQQVKCVQENPHSSQEFQRINDLPKVQVIFIIQCMSSDTSLLTRHDLCSFLINNKTSEEGVKCTTV